MVAEFINAYSDDQIYLDMLEALVAAHPREPVVAESIKYSALCRLWSVLMVGGVECMIKEWARDESAMHDVYAYFEHGSNAQRVERLQIAFHLRGLEPKVEQFEDFLAVKYIRNAYVHGEWKPKQREFVVNRDFPGTLMSFEAYHLERMKSSYLHVMRCLGMVNAFNTLLTHCGAEPFFQGDTPTSFR